MNPCEFHAYGPAHLTVIFLTIALPFVLAAIVQAHKIAADSRRAIIVALSVCSF